MSELEATGKHHIKITKKELANMMGRLSADNLEALTTRQQNLIDPDLAGQLKLIYSPKHYDKNAV